MSGKKSKPTSRWDKRWNDAIDAAIKQVSDSQSGWAADEWHDGYEAGLHSAEKSLVDLKKP